MPATTAPLRNCRSFPIEVRYLARHHIKALPQAIALRLRRRRLDYLHRRSRRRLSGFGAMIDLILRRRRSRSRSGGGIRTTGHRAWVTQWRVTRLRIIHAGMVRRPAPMTITSPGSAPMLVRTRPAGSLSTCGWMHGRGGLLPHAAASASCSRRQAASCHACPSMLDGRRFPVCSPPGGVHASTGSKSAPDSRVICSATCSARRLAGEPLTAAITRRTPRTACLLACNLGRQSTPAQAFAALAGGNCWPGIQFLTGRRCAP